MKTNLSTNPKVLLTTCYRRSNNDYLDYIAENVYAYPRVSAPRRLGAGIRFIKQNVPEVEILEYPTWKEYVDRLKEGWDVVGFSFYQNEVGDVERMAEEARRHGVKETWAGNYGALDAKVPDFVDRVFIGPAEDQVARVFGRKVPEGEIIHPPIMASISFVPGNIRHLAWGFLYTQHGCPYKCTFCQTPAFIKKRLKVNFDSIKRLLAYYKKLGINDIFIVDEIFGINPQTADELTELLARYRFRWWAQSRASLFTHNLDTWYERGLRFPLVGVEAMSQQALNDVDKRQKIEETSEFVRRTREKKAMYRMAYYMIGYPSLDLEETWEDVKRVKRLGFDAHQVNIVTPFPQTPLADEIENKYGIFDRDYRHYDVKNLVWHHPTISPSRMKYLLNSTIYYLNQPLNIYIRGFGRLVWERLRTKGADFIWRDLIKGSVASWFIDDRKPVFLSPHKVTS